jgi:hypothetical protein
VNVLLNKFDVLLPPFLKLIIYLNFYFFMFLLRIFIITLNCSFVNVESISNFSVKFVILTMYFRIKEKDFPQKLETPNCTIITINTIEKYTAKSTKTIQFLCQRRRIYTCQRRRRWYISLCWTASLLFRLVILCLFL